MTSYIVLLKVVVIITKKDKLIQKIKNAKIADFDDIHTLLLQLGFSFRVVGSHYTYIKAPSYVIVIAKHGKQVKRVYLKNVQDLLERMGL
jgi:predicted RNA binding protein YcfA (HicA-like mRNA interferase family)